MLNDKLDFVFKEYKRLMDSLKPGEGREEYIKKMEEKYMTESEEHIFNTMTKYEHHTTAVDYKLSILMKISEACGRIRFLSELTAFANQ